MRKLFLILLILFTSFLSYSQFCSTPNVAMGSINPTTTWQNITVSPGSMCYWTFNAIAGSIYDFSTCNSATGHDTYLRIYNTPTGGTIMHQVDDSGPFCASLLSSMTWTCPTTGTYSILLTNYPCTNLSATTVLSYRVNIPAPGPCTNSNFNSNQSLPLIYQFETKIMCQTANQYSLWTPYEIGVSYYVYSSIPTDWITVRQGTYNGSAVAFGTQPVMFTVTSNITYYIHVNTDGLCGMSDVCRMITVQRISALPVELIYFEGTKYSKSNYLEWATATEHNTSHFTIEKSEDGYTWKPIGQTPSAINSTQEMYYNLTDENISPVINYYILKQFDIDGMNKEYGPIAIDNREKIKKVIKIINLLGQEVDENETGIVIEVYEDGTLKRMVK